MKLNSHNEHLSRVLTILENVGVSNLKEKRILDFGCGAGEIVWNLIEKGLDAYGCDMTEGATMMKDPVFPVGSLNGEEKLKVISLNPYRLPFEDNFFDIVISNQVFEQLTNLDIKQSIY